MLVLTAEQKTAAVKALVNRFNLDNAHDCNRDYEWDYAGGLVDGVIFKDHCAEYLARDDKQDRDGLFFEERQTHEGVKIYFAGTLEKVCDFWCEHLVAFEARLRTKETIDEIIEDDCGELSRPLFAHAHLTPLDPMCLVSLENPSFVAFLKERLGWRKCEDVIDAVHVIHDCYDEFWGGDWTVESAALVGAYNPDEMREAAENQRDRLIWCYRIASILYNDPMLPLQNQSPRQLLRDQLHDLFNSIEREIEEETDEIDNDARHYDYT